MLLVEGSPPVAGTPVEGVLDDVEPLCCMELPLLIELPGESVGLGMLLVEGSPPVAGTPVEGVVEVELRWCIDLPLRVEFLVGLGGLGMLVVEGSPPVAGTPVVELGELSAGAALLGWIAIAPKKPMLSSPLKS